MKRLIILSLIYNVLILPLAAEEDSSDSEYFKKISDLLTIRTAINRSMLALTIRPVEEDINLSEGEIIRYSPNTMENLNISVSWKGFGVGFSQVLPFTQLNTDTYGKTEYSDFQCYYHSTHWGADFYRQEYKGFYLLFPQRFGYEPGDPETFRSDIKATTLGINAFYSFFDNFSFSAAFNQSQKQLKSGGSIMIMLSLMKFKIESNNSLIPPDQEQYYGENAGYRGGDYHSVGISPGCGYTFIWRDWFVTAAGFAGGGLMNKNYENDQGTGEKNETFGRFNARGSIGKNADSYFFGCLGIYNTTSAERWWNRDSAKTVVRADVIFLEAYAGMRFDI